METHTAAPSDSIGPEERATFAIALLTNLPYAAASLTGIGGDIKADPSHFVVQEKLPYEPCGEGEHIYVTFRRSGWNTADAARTIQKRLHLKPSDVGWGGRKDKTAVVEQTLSFRCGVKRPLSDIEEVFADLPFELMDVRRHGNKIKTGHVAANRFSIIVSDPVPDALEKAKKIEKRLKHTGVPNFYGPQRFGYGMRNVQKGFSLFSATKRGKKDSFMVSVIQSALFNIWLERRMESGQFSTLLSGDIVKKTDTGGMFTVEDLTAEALRFNAGEIVYTGPMFGFKMKPARDTAGEREVEVLDLFHLTPQDFRPFRAPGSRREAVLHLSDLAITAVEKGLQFSFTLPAGAYATTVLREFTRET